MYYAIPTNRGLEKIEEYYRAEKVVKLTHMGFGGINGDDAGYIRPDPDATNVPQEWLRMPLERHPPEGFTGGGATISNSMADYRGKWVRNIGIYDEDGELILIAAYRPIIIDPEDSIVSSYPIDIFVVLSRAESVVVVTDTSITHPTHDEFHSAIEKLSRYATTEEKGLIELATQQEVSDGVDNKRAVTPSTLKHELDAIKDDIGNQGTELSKYATTESAGLIELATQQEVSNGVDNKRAVTPSTLKHELDAIKDDIGNQGTELSKYATTESAGLIEIATQAEVDACIDNERAVTPATLDKQGLIASLQQFATQKAEDVKQFILGGVPSSSLDTILEIDKALQQTGDAIRAVYDTIATKLSISKFNEYKNDIANKLNTINQSITTKLSTSIFNEYKTDIANKLNVINQNIANLAPRVTVFNGRHVTFTIPNIKGSVVTFTLQSQRDGSINNPKLGKAAECTFILIGSNQIERIGYWFVQQSRTQFSEFVVSAMIHGDNVVFTVEEQFYNSDSDHEPTTPSFTSTACHFKDIVVRA
ncbi:TPA: phage tail protein [Photobacterium damselae]